MYVHVHCMYVQGLSQREEGRGEVLKITRLPALQRAEEHLMLETQECSVYRNVLNESEEQVQAHFLLEGGSVLIAPASNNITALYSFNFAQHSSNPLQPQSIF